MKKIIIAIDGPAASGKGTLSRELSNKLNYKYFPTGDIYRALAKYINSNNINYNKESDVNKILETIDIESFDYNDIHNEHIANIASIVASYVEVRKIMSNMQRNYIKNSSESMIVEGRDIGSIIYPESDLKFHLTASLDVRAHRRYIELQKRGIKVIYENILSDLQKRDQRDKERSISPLVISFDAIKINSDYMNSGEVLDFCMIHVNDLNNKLTH